MLARKSAKMSVSAPWNSSLSHCSHRDLASYAARCSRKTTKIRLIYASDALQQLVPHSFRQTDTKRPILLLRTSRRIVNRKDRFAFLIGPILWGHSGPLCHALLLLLWTSILHCQSPGVATVARRLRYSYSCRASAHLGSGVDSSDTW